MADQEEKKVHILTAIGNHHVGLQVLPYHSLTSSATASGELKVRAVFHNRMLKKAGDLKGGYMPNQPMSVRRNQDGTHTIFDGNHRYEAIKYLMEHGGPNQPYTSDTQIPCVVYGSTMPTQLAMKFAVLTNEIQLCAAGSTPLDFLRFVFNLSRECVSEGGTSTAMSVFTAFNDMFEQAGVSAPSFANYRHIARVFSFLAKFVGHPPTSSTLEAYGVGLNAFTESEMLQDLDAVEIRSNVFACAKVFAVYIPQTEMDPFVSDDTVSQAPIAFTKHIKGASPSCFMHVSMMGFDTKGLKHLAQSDFRLKFPNLPTDVIPTVLFVRMLWAHWVLTGGVPADNKKCVAIVEDLLDHLKAWDHYIEMENLKVHVKETVEDELPGGSAEKFLAGLDPTTQVSVLEGASVDAVMSDDWPSIAEQLENKLDLPKNSVLFFGQHACRHSFDRVDEGFKPVGERPVAEVAWKDIRRCADIVNDLKDFVPRWLEAAAGESTDCLQSLFRTQERLKNTLGTLTFLSALHLLQRPSPGGGVRGVLSELSLLKKCIIDDWHLKWEEKVPKGMDRENWPRTCKEGLSFIGIDSEIAARNRVVVKAQLAADTTKRLSALEVNARRSRTEQIRRTKETDIEKRNLERAAAVELEKKVYEARENKVERQAQDIEVSWKKDNAEMWVFGMPPSLYRVLAVPNMLAKLFSVPEQEGANFSGHFVDHLKRVQADDDSAREMLAIYNGIQHSRIYFMDVTKSDNTVDELAEELREVLQHFASTTGRLGGFVGKVSILCRPSQQNSVYRGLNINGFTNFDATHYTAGACEEAFTLSDCEGTNFDGDDAWDIHRLLLPVAAEDPYTRTMSPLFLIISAGSSKHIPPADRDILRKGDKYRREVLSKIPAPMWTSTQAGKYKYELNMSKHWGRSNTFPSEFAMANFLFWHACEGDIITVRGSLRTALVARALGHPVFYVTTRLKEAESAKAFKDLALLAEPSIVAEYFAGYKTYEHLLTVVQWCMEARKCPGLDAYQLLLQQPTTMEERFLRSDDYYSNACKAMKCKPFIVKHPQR